MEGISAQNIDCKTKEDLIKESFVQLYPEKNFNYSPKISYSNKFSKYNASIIRRGYSLEIRASGAWKEISNDIFIGLVQTLLIKLFGQPVSQTYAMDMYSRFIKNIHISIPKIETDKVLEESFNRVNEQFFSNQLETANLKWGEYSKRRLGSYDFQTDTIKISKILGGRDNRLLDYVMFHEMLHKKLKFSNKKTKNYFHTSEFRDWEKKFPLHEEIEYELKYLGRKKKNLLVWLSEKFK